VTSDGIIETSDPARRALPSGEAIKQALCPVIVGRQEELAILEDLVRATAAGEGHVAIVSGDAGAGKSRLLGALAEHAEAHGLTVVTGACAESDLALPYLPFVEALGAHLVGVDKEWFRALGDARHELAKLFPQLDAAPRQEVEDPVMAKLRLFESIATLLTAMARDHGLLAIVEDVQWADASTRELFEYLSHRAARQPWMLVVTYRPDEVDRRHPLHSAIQAWRRAEGVTLLELHPLSVEQVAEMVAAIVEGEKPPPQLAEVLHRRSEGNPFVLEELLKDALDSTAARRPDGAWDIAALERLRLPQTVTDSILLRVDRLEPRQADIVRAAAVVGTSFRAGWLEYVCDASPAEVGHALEAAIAQQVVEADEQGAGERYRFRHTLTREALYKDMLEGERQRLHLRAAEALRDQPGVAPVEVAGHLLAGGAGEAAVPLCLAAADEALRNRGYAEAADLYRRVVQYVADPVERAVISCRLGEALWKSGNPAAAEETLEPAIAGLEREGMAAQAAHATLTLARCRWERASLDAAQETYEHARELLLADGASADLAAAYAGLAALYAFELDGPRTQHNAELAIAVAGEVGADSVLSRAYSLLGIALVFQGQVDAGIGYLDQSYAEAVAHDLDWNALTALYNSIVIRLWHLRAAECPALLKKLLALPSGWWRDLAYWRGTALTAHHLAHLGEVLPACDEVAALADQGGALTFKSWAARQRAYTLSELGRASEALDTLPARRAGEDRQELFFDYQVRMRVHLDLDEPKMAAELAHIVLAADDWANDSLLIAVAIEAFVAAHELAKARRLLALAVTRGCEPDNPYMLASAGRIDIAAGDYDAATPRLEAAAAAFAASHYRLEEARTRVLLAETLHGAGAITAARKQVAGAVRVATGCGAAEIERRARRAARQMGFRIGRTTRPLEPGEPLTPARGERANIVSDLRMALRGGELLLHYQPKLNLASDEVDAVEALIRWQHPRLGLLYPDRFIPVAEKTGLIAAITEFAIDAGLAQAASWLQRGRDVRVAVNLAASDLDNARFPEMVERALEANEVDPGRLRLEITESQIMAHPERAIETLHALHTLNVPLSIDDFGTGHSSLAYVRSLPVSEIKVDRSFCMELDDRALVILRSAIAMGHDLGMKVTAEGVESRDAMERIKELGCDYAQGYYIGRAVPAAVLSRRLRRGAAFGSASARPRA